MLAGMRPGALCIVQLVLVGRMQLVEETTSGRLTIVVFNPSGFCQSSEVVRLSCGLVFTSGTRLPHIASPMPRFVVIASFTTPSLWLTMAMVLHECMIVRLSELSIVPRLRLCKGGQFCCRSSLTLELNEKAYNCI